MQSFQSGCLFDIVRCQKSMEVWRVLSAFPFFVSLQMVPIATPGCTNLSTRQLEAMLQRTVHFQSSWTPSPPPACELTHSSYFDTERDNATASIVVEGSWKVTLVSWMQCGCNCSCVSVAPTHRLHTERDNATALIIVEAGVGELLESYATVLDAVRLPIAVVSLHSAHFGVATTKQP